MTDVNEFATTPISDTNRRTKLCRRIWLSVHRSESRRSPMILDGTDTVSYSLLNAQEAVLDRHNTGVVTLASASTMRQTPHTRSEFRPSARMQLNLPRLYLRHHRRVNEFATTAVVDNEPAADTVCRERDHRNRRWGRGVRDDLDGTDTVSYSLRNDAGGLFAIDASTGIVTVASGLDYETSTSHTIRVQALSTDGSSTFRDFTISVTEINEFDMTSITDVNGAVNVVAENSAIVLLLVV